MAFCGSCGAQVAEGMALCGSCGKPVGAARSVSAAPGANPATTSGISSNVAGALAYVLGLITGILFLVLDPYKNDRFVRFHAFQSIFFCGAFIVVRIAWNIVWGILGSLTGGLLIFVAAPISILISLGGFVYWLFLMYKAYNNERYMIPFIGGLASKQAG